METMMTTVFDPRAIAARGAAASVGDWATTGESAPGVVAAIEAQRGPLVRCATWLLGDRLAAQRVVEAALADAAGSSPKPTDPAALRRWLFGFVKRGVVHALRRELRIGPLRDDSHEDGGDGAPAFLADGHWCSEPVAWGDGQTAPEQATLQLAIQRCIDRLPPNTARVYALREVLGLDTGEICETLGLQEERCASMLCRARLAVHQRLQREWLTAQGVQ